jgi:pimeloyl-ACP methyl ester carboxylesterase
MFKKYFFLLFLLLFFSACASKKPITWENRIVHEKQKKLPLVYDEYGDKKHKTLLFLHGFGENRHTWRFLVSELSKEYHLVMVDLKGFGDSPKIEDGQYSVYDQAKVLSSFIEEHNFKELTLVGRSFGGGVALVLALMQEEKLLNQKIERLILINSMSYRQSLPSMLKTLNYPIIGFLAIHFISNDWMAEEGYRYAFYNNSLIPKESVAYTSAYLSAPLAKYAYLETVAQLIPDDIAIMEKKYRKIDLPTLILWGKADVSISVRMAYKLNRDLKNSHLITFSKVGHMPQEEVPQKVVHEIRKFMEVKP